MSKNNSAKDHLRKEEYYYSIEEEFSALHEAGFSTLECFWRKGPVAVFGGRKI